MGLRLLKKSPPIPREVLTHDVGGGGRAGGAISVRRPAYVARLLISVSIILVMGMISHPAPTGTPSSAYSPRVHVGLCAGHGNAIFGRSAAISISAGQNVSGYAPI